MKKKEQIIIALEGIDGAGKSTLIQKIKKQFGKDISVYRRTHKGRIIDKIVTSRVMQQHYMLQVPIYLLLSYKNYFLYKVQRRSKIVIMDRCFLSNLCYFFPKAIYDKKLCKKIIFFEIKFFPEAIFILDVDPLVGRTRDNDKKPLEWMENTREAYLNVLKSYLADFIHIRVIDERLSMKEKEEVIEKYIRGRLYYGNR